MPHGLNARLYTARNYAALDTGWVIDDSGRAVDQDTAAAWTDFTIKANIQPYTGKNRNPIGGTLAVVENRIRGDVYRYAGSFPTIIPADNGQNLLPTRVTFQGQDYEVVLTKDWTSGLLPYIYFEAELLAEVRTTAGPDTDTTLPAEQQMDW